VSLFYLIYSGYRTPIQAFIQFYCLTIILDYFFYRYIKMATNDK
jgi:hypothetical protein